MTQIPGWDLLDALNTLILAVPGTAIGIAYIRAFHVEIPGLGLALTSLWIIMPLVLAVRRLPYTVRGSYASLLLVHTSMEEAAALGFILIIVASVSLVVINKVAGTRMGGMFG